MRCSGPAGQDVAATVGEGRISNPLVTKSLQAADDLVRSNCVGGDRVVYTSSDPGPFAPALPALKNIGPMLHCGVSAGTTTTTSTASPTTGATTPTTFPTNIDSGTSNPTLSSNPATTPSSIATTPTTSRSSR